MSQLLPPTEYMQSHYLHDFGVFGSTSMCGFSMVDALDGRKRAAIHGLAEFTLAQFGLNLLNQATFAHTPEHAFAWKRFSPPLPTHMDAFLDMEWAVIFRTAFFALRRNLSAEAGKREASR